MAKLQIRVEDQCFNPWTDLTGKKILHRKHWAFTAITCHVANWLQTSGHCKSMIIRMVWQAALKNSLGQAMAESKANAFHNGSGFFKFVLVTLPSCWKLYSLACLCFEVSFCQMTLMKRCFHFGGSSGNLIFILTNFAANKNVASLSNASWWHNPVLFERKFQRRKRQLEQKDCNFHLCSSLNLDGDAAKVWMLNCEKSTAAPLFQSLISTMWQKRHQIWTVGWIWMGMQTSNTKKRVCVCCIRRDRRSSMSTDNFFFMKKNQEEWSLWLVRNLHKHGHSVRTLGISPAPQATYGTHSAHCPCGHQKSRVLIFFLKWNQC